MGPVLEAQGNAHDEAAHSLLPKDGSLKIFIYYTLHCLVMITILTQLIPGNRKIITNCLHASLQVWRFDCRHKDKHQLSREEKNQFSGTHGAQ